MKRYILLFVLLIVISELFADTVPPQKIDVVFVPDSFVRVGFSDDPVLNSVEPEYMAPTVGLSLYTDEYAIRTDKDNLYFQCNRKVGSRLQYNLRNGQVRQSKKSRNDILFSKNVSLNRTLPGFLGADSTGVYYCYRNEQLSELKFFLQEGYLSDKVENKELLKQTNEDTNPMICYYEFK